MQLMLECKRYVCVRLPNRENRKSLNYTELGRQALGWFGKWAVDISVLACNLGVCAGYMIFIAGNLHVSYLKKKILTLLSLSLPPPVGRKLL